MESQKINRHEEPISHKFSSAMRFLENLQTEIKLAQNLEDIQDKLILDKFKEVIQLLKNNFTPQPPPTHLSKPE